MKTAKRFFSCPSPTCSAACTEQNPGRCAHLCVLGHRLEFPFHLRDIAKRRQAGLIAEALYLVGGRRARKDKMLVPAFTGILEIGMDVGAMEHVTCAAGVEHTL